MRFSRKLSTGVFSRVALATVVAGDDNALPAMFSLDTAQDTSTQSANASKWAVNMFEKSCGSRFEVAWRDTQTTKSCTVESGMQTSARKSKHQLNARDTRRTVLFTQTNFAASLKSSDENTYELAFTTTRLRNAIVHQLGESKARQSRRE